MEKEIEKANVLMEALPYMKAFHDKVVVIKFGGSTLVEENLKKSIILDIVLMWYVGMRPVIVHGGGPFITQKIQDSGKKSQFIHGLRITDEETIDIVKEVLMEVNREMVALLTEAGTPANGFSGDEEGIITAQKHFPTPVSEGGNAVDVGFVGDVVDLGGRLLEAIDRKDSVFVITPLGRGKDGAIFNINADEVAGEIAARLPAEKLVLLTDVPGIMRNSDEGEVIIPTLQNNQVEELIRKGIISGGMIPKVRACVKALNAGVAKTHIIDGRISHSLLLEIFTDKGVGTQIVESQ